MYARQKNKRTPLIQNNNKNMQTEERDRATRDSVGLLLPSKLRVAPR